MRRAFWLTTFLRTMKLLTFSTPFPNAEQAKHGWFAETHLCYLVADGKVESRVPASVQQCPLKHTRCARLMADGSAERFSWDDTTQGQVDLFEHILAGRN